MKKILLLAYHEISRDPRVYKQIKWMEGKYDVTTLCKIPANELKTKYVIYPDTNFFMKKLRMVLLLLRMYNKYLWDGVHRTLVENLKKNKFDLIIAHHIYLLPIAFKIAEHCGAKVVLDAHEYYTEIYNDSFLWRLFMKKYFVWLSENNINRCSCVIAVNESMKDLYEKNFNINADYITNASEYVKIEPKKVDSGNIKIIHHGLASRSRKLELMVEMCKYLEPRFSVTFMIVEISVFSRLYVKKLKKIASKFKNITFLNPVAGNEVVKFGNNFDIGLFFMPPSNINEEYSLANKFFQYVQSRLMLAVSPLPEMKRLIDEYNIGIYSQGYNPELLAKKINKLSAEDIHNYKLNSDKCAYELSSEKNMKKFLNILEKLL